MRTLFLLLVTALLVSPATAWAQQGCEVTIPQRFRLLESLAPNSGGPSYPAMTRVRAIALGSATRGGTRAVRVRIDSAEGWVYLWPSQLRACPAGSVAQRPGDVASAPSTPPAAPTAPAAPTTPAAPPATAPAPPAPPAHPAPEGGSDVQFDASPPCIIRVGRRSYGTTPVTVHLPVGTHNIVCQREEGTSVAEVLEVPPGGAVIMYGFGVN